MATATQQQAREAHAEQAALAAAAALSAQQLLAAGADWATLLARIAGVQLRAAALAIATVSTRLEREPLISPAPFAGVSAYGYPISEPLIATIDERVPAPVEPLPAPWWDDTAFFSAAVAQLVESEVQDAARSAGQAEMFAQKHEHYVRILVPPSCKRCTVLAGGIYRTDAAFDRHPGCDCTSEPVASLQDAIDRGLVVTPEEAVERDWVRDLTVAERQAIADGADATAVINSASGISTATFGGRRVKVTKHGTTRRAAWRQKNPSARVRLRPETIYQIADGDRGTALRLLDSNGYRIRSASRAPTASDSVGGRGSGADGPGDRPPADGAPAEPPDDDLPAWKARQDALEGDSFTANGETLEPAEVRFAERMVRSGERLSWIKTGSNGSDRVGTMPTNDFHFWTGGEVEVEHKALDLGTPVDARHIARQITKAARKNKRRLIVRLVVVDLGSHDLDPADRLALQDYNLTAQRPIEGLWLMIHGQLVPVSLH